jgi:glycosyltransferase involved in cell wall biosynthesis
MHMLPEPLINITIPVFNRLDETRRTLESVKKHTHMPHFLIVVDNGSEPHVNEYLREARAHGLIDHLFVLGNNYGISCAVNVGWRMAPASYYMKLDNDMEIIMPGWLDSIFARWRHCAQPSIIGPIWHDRIPWRAGERVITPDGELYTARKSLPGCAFIVPRQVVESLGYFNEDYGLYGAEDADYSVRVLVAGFGRYAFEADPLMAHLGISSEMYEEHGIDKNSIDKTFAGSEESLGLYSANEYMFKMGIRDLNVPSKYVISKVEDEKVVININRAYLPFRRKLMTCVRLIDMVYRDSGKMPLVNDNVVEKLKNIMSG